MTAKIKKIQIVDNNTSNTTTVYPQTIGEAVALKGRTLTQAITSIDDKLSKLSNSCVVIYSPKDMKIDIDGYSFNISAYSRTTLYPTSSLSFNQIKYLQPLHMSYCDVSRLDTSSFTTFNNMFASINGFMQTLDVSNWETSNVTDMTNTFLNCRFLTCLDVGGWDTSKVTNMLNLFSGCNRLTALNVHGFNTSNVTNMSGMFQNCSELPYIDVTLFDTANVTNMSGMFQNCEAVTDLNLSSFDTTSVTNISNMFKGCANLTNLTFGTSFGKQKSTATDAITLDLTEVGSNMNYTLTSATWSYMLKMYDRKTANLINMIIKLNKNHNVPSDFESKMNAIGYSLSFT